jgi:hypothetical protein
VQETFASGSAPTSTHGERWGFLTTSQRIKAAMLDYSLEIACVETPTVFDAERLEGVRRIGQLAEAQAKRFSPRG